MHKRIASHKGVDLMEYRIGRRGAEWQVHEGGRVRASYQWIGHGQDFFTKAQVREAAVAAFNRIAGK